MIPWPTCAVCQKPVDKLEVSENVADDQTVYVAYCHGEKETSTVDRMFFIRQYEFTGAIAFSKKRLK